MSTLTRRRLIQGIGAATAPAAAATSARAEGAAGPSPDTRRASDFEQSPNAIEAYSPALLPAGIRSRYVEGINGLRVHVLEAGFAVSGRPCVLLLHGFPELAYSWRKVMPSIAAAGFHVIAPDLRGYGRTTGWDDDYDGDLGAFRLLNYVGDAVGLMSAFGYRSVAALCGHDFGSIVAAWCALVRPDVFRSVAIMSAPFAGPPALPFNTAERAPSRTAAASPGAAGRTLDEELAALDPPRKQYRRYYSTREANDDMRNAPQGIHAFMRAYYHMKSADWKQNKPFPLQAVTARELARLPTYYVMELGKNMAETVAAEMPSASEIAACRWLPEEELTVYSSEYWRTGFQGGLQGYRVRLVDKYNAELQTFSGRTIDVPSLFIAGRSDWGAYQTPGALESMQKTACTRMLGTHLVDGAGHWVQQEQPEAVTRLLIEFLQYKA
jgi:pimeloyl-ACP methyl ester carboxylesterase